MQINIKRGRLKTANRLFRQMTLPVVFGLLSLSAGQTWANSGEAGRFVQCTATVQGNGTFNGQPALVFGSQGNGVNLLNNNQPEDIQATINYTCSNTITQPLKVRLCFNIDGGQGSTSIYTPRKMFYTQNRSQTLQLLLLKSDNTYWGTDNTANSPSSASTDIMRIPAKDTVTGSMTIKARLVSVQSNIIPTTTGHSYLSNFINGSTALSWRAAYDTAPDPVDCGGFLTNQRFPFYVQAHVAPVCEFISADDIDFGTHTAGSTNLKQSGNPTVRCTNGTPYTVGLIPSNNNQEGRGEMKSTNPANTDKVPYRLRKGTYATAPFWGNKPSAPGKAQEFTGDGSSQTHTISAEVQNTDYTPGEYKDKVTVDIRY